MKKLVYILSIAIGLFMTGCAQWEDFESQAPDTWGAVPELVVSLDSTCLDEAGNLIKDYLPLTITTKHATHMGYAVSLSPVEMDYTALLQGAYGNYVAEADSAGWELKQNLSGVAPGNTYYVYAVAANGAGIQATSAIAVGAVDVDAPQPLTNPQLTATQGGKRAVIAFNENIIRDENMGAISYTVYNAETNELFAQGAVADATAAGANLTVTLPETVVYNENDYYIVVLSFAEGAVTDLYGNKMAAIEGVYNADEMYVENGYWWLVEPTPTMSGFFNEGAYTWSFQFTDDGESWYDLSTVTTFSYVGATNLGEIYDAADLEGIAATRWEVSGFLEDLGFFEGAEARAFPAFSYEMDLQGETYECLDLLDPDYGPCSIGNAVFVDNSGGELLLDLYLGEVSSEGALYYNLMFVVQEGTGYYNGEQACIFYVYNDQPYLFAYLADVMIDAEASATAKSLKCGKVSLLDEPIRVEKVGGIKTISLKK